MNENVKPTQTDRVLDYMDKFGSITQLQALADLGVMRLASRISEIRNVRNIPVKKTMVSTRNRFGEKVSFAEYSLVKEGE